jgi:hypothetical protein
MRTLPSTQAGNSMPTRKHHGKPTKHRHKYHIDLMKDAEAKTPPHGIQEGICSIIQSNYQSCSHGPQKVSICCTEKGCNRSYFCFKKDSSGHSQKDSSGGG